MTEDKKAAQARNRVQRFVDNLRDSGGERKTVYLSKQGARALKSLLKAAGPGAAQSSLIERLILDEAKRRRLTG